VGRATEDAIDVAAHVSLGREARADVRGELPADVPGAPSPPSIFRDQNRRDTGKSQSIWTDSKMKPPAHSQDPESSPVHMTALRWVPAQPHTVQM
jgi:hypothetical protein